eukprot:3426215-Prymnesium_polylepis.2
MSRTVCESARRHTTRQSEPPSDADQRRSDFAALHSTGRSWRVLQSMTLTSSPWPTSATCVNARRPGVACVARYKMTRSPAPTASSEWLRHQLRQHTGAKCGPRSCCTAPSCAEWMLTLLSQPTAMAIPA